jgi:SAM-dependent methyltransferase
MQVVRTIAELDGKLAECDAAGRDSEDRKRALLGGFRMEAPQDLPSDPFSPAYRQAQLGFYEAIAGHPYSAEYEATKFDVDAYVERPFPFYTGSSAVAGEYFMAIGAVLRAMALPPGSRVLEFGAGWAWTSLLLAQLGHKVTVIDIEPCYCELIARRAAREGVEIEVVNDDFFCIETLQREFDAVLFYSCFHHCDDHMRLLGALKRVTAVDGRIYFGAEPIEAGFPYPWGVRLDGRALWDVRRNGWLELGFRDDYFVSALMRAGWFPRRVQTEGAGVWEARRLEGLSFRFPASGPEIRTQIGAVRGDALVLDGRAQGAAVFGPYIELPAGAYLARIGFLGGRAPRGPAVMDVAAEAGERRIAELSLSDGRPAEIPFRLDTHARNVEVRLHVEQGFAGEIEYVEIAPR